MVGTDTDNERTPVTEVKDASPRRRARSGWLWAGLAFLLGLSLPALACVGLLIAVGAAAGVAGGSPDSSLGVGPAVGVIRVEGVIVPGDSVDVFGQGAGSGTVVAAIEQADADPAIKAILLRVDSPGGGVVASAEIHHALTQVDKPIVVSMGTVAASGGYYISAPADYVIASPDTLTGSIGVISSFVTAEDLLDEVGVDIVVLTTGEFKDTGGISRDMTEADIAYWQAILDEAYGGFVEVVADGRGLTEQEVRELADGRVFTGRQALELGLVDELGYFDDALAKAAELGGIAGEPRVIEVESVPDFFSYLAASQAANRGLSGTLELLERVSQPRLEFRYPGP